MTTAKEVSHAAYLLGLSALRNLPESFEKNLEQSRLLDDRLKAIAENFEVTETHHDK